MKLIKLNDDIKVGSVVQESRIAAKNLNDCNYNSTFYIPEKALNIPSGDYEYGQLIVSRNEDTVVQLAFKYDDASMFKIRVGNKIGTENENWTPWKTFNSID